jgi:SAM-dependent methyltransferase
MPEPNEMNSTRDHWQAIYATKAEQQTSWYRPHLDASLALIDGLDLDLAGPVIDVGGGRASLVGDLLQRGYHDLTVLDLSDAALGQSRQCLGPSGGQVRWIAGDILDTSLEAAHYALWHDRAVFHFLIDADLRRRYAAQAARAIRPRGWLLLATFAPDGPGKCSDLPVQRYDAAALAAEFRDDFEAVADLGEMHETPFGTRQPFTYLLMRRLGDAGL